GDARRAVRMFPGEADSALLAGPSPLTGSWAVIEAGSHGHWVRGREHTLPEALSGAIVVGTDGSPEAERAVEWAAGEAVLRGRSLRIVHAVERWPFRVPLLAPSDGAVEEGKAILEAARAAVRERWPDLGVTTALVEEETEKALREESKEAFALVLGRRGRGGFAGMPLGSTSRRMASESSVPVVIVRGEASEGGEVVVGVDLSWDSELVLEHAFETASLYGARLRAVHAWMVYGMPVESGAVFDEEAVHDELLGRVVAAHEPLRKKYPHV